MAPILGIDRFMNECCALTNFIGNAVACVVVACWEGECDIDRLTAALDGHPVAVEPMPEPSLVLAAKAA